jgi:serine/threonine-protein kinase
VRALIGKGAAGTVYQAWDEELARPVAIKLLHSSDSDSTGLARFRREARIIASLSHPNIVGVYDIGQHHSLPYIVMEFVPGSSLADLMRSGVPFTLRQKLAVLKQVCGALACAHARDIVHRDVKPANILVTPERTAKLTDFGVAHLRESDLTNGAIVGTPAYIPPEAIRNYELDGRSDLYSLGVTLYEWLTGTRPYLADSIEALLRKILTERPPDVRDHWPACPQDVAVLVRRTLEPEPLDRFQSAADLEEALACLCSVPESSVLPREETTTRPGLPTAASAPDVRSSSRRLALWAAAGIAVIVALALGGTTDWRDADPPWSDVAGKDIQLPPERSRSRPAAVPIDRAERDAVSPLPAIPTESAASDVPIPSTPEDVEAPENAGPAVDVVPAGTRLLVNLRTELRTDRTRPGDEFMGDLAEALVRNGLEIAPAGARLRGLVDTVEDGGSGSPPSLELSLRELTLGAATLPIRTGRYQVIASTIPGEPGIGTLVLGAVIGAAIGGALDGKTGAAIGAGAGGVAGLAGRRDRSTEYQVGERITFKLATPIRIVGQPGSGERR